MNKKISIGVCISLIAIACTVTFVVTWTVSLNMYNDIIPGAVQRDEISSKLQEIDSFVRNNFLYDIKDEEIAFGVFAGYISGVGDKNTVYMTADEYVRHSKEEVGQFVTGGVRAEKEASGYIEVAEVYSGSSAENAGIVKNDLITAIDGMDVLRMEPDAAIRLLEGEENTKFTLTIRREGEDVDFSLIRRSIDIISVEAEVVNNVGLIRITTFNALTANQFNEALQMFTDSNGFVQEKVQDEFDSVEQSLVDMGSTGIRALLIDLRNNSGDFYAPISDMVNSLIDAQTVAYTNHRGGIQRSFIVTDDSDVFLRDIPIIILTNSDTSGAGELMAAILKSHADAQIVGSNTAGNAYIRQTQPLKDGSAIRVTIARIALSSGLEYADSGLIPDYAVDMNAEVSYITSELRGREHAEIRDPQIRKAFEIIETVA